MPIIAYDLIAVLILAFFIHSGYRKGFFLTLCDFIAMFVAFVGATFITIHFAAPISDVIAPMIQVPLEALIESQTDGGLLTELESSFFWSGFLDRMEMSGQLSLTSVVQPLAAFVALQLTRIVLFLVGFLVVMIGWSMVSRALNLAFHLPIISGINAMGGLVIGLFQGGLMVFLLAWILNSGVLSTTEMESTLFLHYFLDNSPLSLLETTLSQL